MIELQNIKFKEIRPFISKINPISICRYEDLSYENFLCLEDVPKEYSELYIYGIGPVDNVSVELENVKYPCLEIIVSKVPKDKTPNKKSFFDYSYVHTRFGTCQELRIRKEE